MPDIPVESNARNYIVAKAWRYKESGSDQLVLEVCPFCHNDNYKFYINVSGGKKDSLWDCKVCTEAGNLYKLMESEGDSVQGILSMKDAASLGRAPESIPNINSLHRALMEDEDTLDYLIGTRGFSSAVIELYKLGVESRDGVKWLVIPYLHNDTCIFVKYRALPPAKKAFRSLAGRDAPLFNGDAVVSGMDELILVEGESDALSCLSNDVVGVVGVPGANIKKAVWIQKILDCAPKKIYILYDNDTVGQKAAKEMAKRIGLEKVLNIKLPLFTNIDGGTGKDINEWFRAGNKLEDFEILKQQAKPFDVDGVTNLGMALNELEDELNEKGSLEPAITTHLPSLNLKLGGCEFGDLVGVIAEGKVGKTTFCLNLLDNWVAKGMPCMMYCLEMPPKRLARKWASYVTQTDDTPGRSQMTAATIKAAKVIAYEREADLLFGYTRGGNKDDVFDTIRSAVRLYGVKVVCFDNLQLLCRSIDHSAQETSVITKMFKELAMELGILILMVVQPNRVKEGEIVGARNSMGSSAIEKDVDSMIALHRKRIASVKDSDLFGFIDTESTFEPQLYVNVDLNRYGPGGKTTLWLEGCTSTVREFNPDELNSMPKPNFGGELPVERQEV